MDLYEPMTETSELPKVRDPESAVLDFKARFGDDDNELERIAKSVAAFANAFGGTLIVGAAADRDERLIRYVGLPDAKEQQQRIQCITNERLSPRWSVHPFERASPEGKTVLVVNVPPSPTPIAYRRDDAWRIPVRTGRETAFLSFEEAQAMMSDERRAQILLAQLEPGWVVVDTVSFSWHFAHPRSGSTSQAGGRPEIIFRPGFTDDVWHFREVQGSSVVLRLFDPEERIVHLPVASVQAVWRDAATNRFVISARCVLYRDGDRVCVSMAPVL